MFLKTKKNQKFGTSDLVALIILTGLVTGISSTIIQDVLRDDRSERALLGAEALAHQMVAGGFGLVDLTAADDLESGRGPASTETANETSRSDNAPTLSLLEGALGRDPWGRPYRYRLLRSSDGDPVRILVWSDGPNLQADSRFQDFEVAVAGTQSKIRFSGDDIGYVYQKP